MSGSLKDYWDEFDWERELKKDDERIAVYLHELPRYIDLPAEDAVILKQIQRKPGLVPADGDYSGTFLDNMFEEEEEPDDVDFSEDWQKRDGADLFMATSMLARLWALDFARNTASDIAICGLQILCLFGKIMARSGDLIDMPEEEYPALKLALVKRLLSDINILLGKIRESSVKITGSAEKTDYYFEQLLIIREKLLQLRKKYFSEKK